MKGGNRQCLGGCVTSLWLDSGEGMAWGPSTSRAWEELSGCGEWIEGTRVSVCRQGRNYCSTLQPEGDGAMVAMEEMEWSEWVQEIFRSKISGAGDGLDGVEEGQQLHEILL